MLLEVSGARSDASAAKAVSIRAHRAREVGCGGDAAYGKSLRLR
jgi:hypothetical protein